jgi:RimJ/RimL family protein N-acetyltransferase
MTISKPLFEGNSIRLASIDREKDPEIESRWTHDPDYLRMLGTSPARPLSPAKVKKNYEDIEKRMDEDKNLFYFTIRTREENGPLIGFAELSRVEWTHGNAQVRLGIGERGARGRGHGTEALGLLLRYAFDELNLHRLTAVIPDYNRAARSLFERMGFVEEVRQRKAVNRDGRRWDLIYLGLLHSERPTGPGEGV